jgi:uroporphyrinogen decarboxylase
MMAPRERVLTALSHQQPDRTPADFWAEPPMLNRLYAHLGHRDRERLARDLEVDVWHLDMPTPADTAIAPGLWQNYWGERFIYRDTPWGPMREDMAGALAGADSLSDLQAFPWPTPDCLDYSGLAAQCQAHDEYALLYGFADIWQRPGLVRGWENWFVDHLEHPAWVHWLCRRFTDFYIEDYTRATEATGGRIDLYLVLTDLGHQTAPLISLPMFREFVAPYVRDLVTTIHGLGGKALYHSCGCMASFIPDLIEAGIDILDPLQPVSPDLQPEVLKAAYGDRLCFHGGLDMQHLLPYGTIAEVQEQVRRYCQTLGAGGGYLLAPAHLFQPEVPPETILAFYDVGLR